MAVSVNNAQQLANLICFEAMGDTTVVCMISFGYQVRSPRTPSEFFDLQSCVTLQSLVD